jgi:hypothetical protein
LRRGRLNSKCEAQLYHPDSAITSAIKEGQTRCRVNIQEISPEGVSDQGGKK